MPLQVQFCKKRKAFGLLRLKMKGFCRRGLCFNDTINTAGLCSLRFCFVFYFFDAVYIHQTIICTLHSRGDDRKYIHLTALPPDSNFLPKTSPAYLQKIHLTLILVFPKSPFSKTTMSGHSYPEFPQSHTAL